VPPAGDREGLAALATREVARLRTAIDQVLDRQDAQDRADTIAGFRLADDDETRCLRRYEAMARRDYNRAHADLLRAQELADLERGDDDEDLAAPLPSMMDLLRTKPVKPHLQRVAEAMKARREAREATAAAAAPAGTGSGTAAAEPAASTSRPAPAPASAAAPSAPSAPAPAAPDQPPPATDEPIKIGQGKSTPAREHMRQVRERAQEWASRRRRKGA
jgi:hypothetical protein